MTSITSNCILKLHYDYEKQPTGEHKPQVVCLQCSYLWLAEVEINSSRSLRRERLSKNFVPQTWVSELVLFISHRIRTDDHKREAPSFYSFIYSIPHFGAPSLVGHVIGISSYVVNSSWKGYLKEIWEGFVVLKVSFLLLVVGISRTDCWLLVFLWDIFFY